MNNYENDFQKFNDLNKINEPMLGSCVHFDFVDENNFITCLDCGKTTRKMNHDFNYSDQNRVSPRTIYDRSIFKDVQHLFFPWDIVSSANEIYDNISGGKILRGDSRKGNIFACIYFAYKKAGNYQIPEELGTIIGLEKKKCLKGLNYVNQRMEPVTNNQLLQTKKYIDKMTNMFTGLQLEKEEILLLHDQLKNKSSELNRIRPQSLIASIIYYSMIKQQYEPKITLAVFTAKVKISDTTIKKNLAVISNILQHGV